ncbi:MAG: ferritin-like domain-containing protein [Alphaproteobacteria bacterium]
MALSKQWSGWWRRFLGTSPEGNGKAAVDILRQRYVEEMQQTNRFKQHAQKMHYPQFRDKLLDMAAAKSKRAEWIAEKIVALGGKLPEVPELRSTDKNSWQYLLMDLEEENRCADPLAEQIWSTESDHADIAEFLQQINEAEKNDRKAIREMLMRSDPFALSLA